MSVTRLPTRPGPKAPLNTCAHNKTGQHKKLETYLLACLIELRQCRSVLGTERDLCKAESGPNNSRKGSSHRRATLQSSLQPLNILFLDTATRLENRVHNGQGKTHNCSGCLSDIQVKVNDYHSLGPRQDITFWSARIIWLSFTAVAVDVAVAVAAPTRPVAPTPELLTINEVKDSHIK